MPRHRRSIWTRDRTACVGAAFAVLLLAALATGAAGCGKKGPPLAPVVKTPALLTDFAARRSGDTVYLRFTVPTTNTDVTKPADLARIEVYAYTALKEVEGFAVKEITLISKIDVRRPPDPEDDRDAKDPSAKPKKPKKEQPPEPGVDQGSIVTVTETLTPDTMTLTPLPKRLRPLVMAQANQPDEGTRLSLPAVGPQLDVSPRRFYFAVAVNHAGLRATPSPLYSVAFDMLPAPPGKVRLDVTEKTIEIAWDPPAGSAVALGPSAVDPLVLPVTSKGMLLPVLPLYNIYAVPKDAVAAALKEGRPVALPLPLNDKPLTTAAFSDDKLAFGVERCYQVRTVNTVGATAQVAAATATAAAVTSVAKPVGVATPAVVESAPSAIACVTPADTVPPPAPTGLAAVASSGAISLIWTGVDAADLAGYIVLRSSTPDGPLSPLFATPIRETTFRDTAVRPNAWYVYAVIAVDKATPPNRSPFSNKATETAR